MKEAFDVDTPKITTDAVQQMLSAELSSRSRFFYAMLLLVAFAASGVIAALLITEPSLPLRTRGAFAVLLAIGLSWVGYAGWVLSRRRVLLTGHRIIAARMSLVFSAIFALGSASLGVWGSMGQTAFAAAGFGLFMIAVAGALLVHARKELARLLERRRMLEIELAGR